MIKFFTCALVCFLAKISVLGISNFVKLFNLTLWQSVIFKGAA